jgi:hypothetical protein
VRNLGRLPHPRGRVTASWNGRDAAGKLASDGSYRLKVSLSGRHIELLNPLSLDTVVRVLSTNVSRRVISPDCDSHGDRVTVVVRGREQLAGLALEVRQGSRLVRTVRVKSRARALAISWPPRAGKRCTTAPDGVYGLRVITRDVPGNTRAFDLGHVRARGVALSLPDRSIIAGRRLRVGLSADARSLRLDLTRLGGSPTVLARGTHAPSAVARIPATAAGGLYAVSNRHAGRSASALLAVRGARPARVALVVAGPTAAVAVYQRRLDALGIPFDVLTERDLERGALRGYRVAVVPAVGARPPAVELAHGKVVHSLAGITPGLGS